MWELRVNIWGMSLPHSASFGDWDPGFKIATCLQPGGLEGVTNHRSSSSAPENRTVLTRACLAALAGIGSADQLPGVGVGAGRSCWQVAVCAPVTGNTPTGLRGLFWGWVPRKQISDILRRWALRKLVPGADRPEGSPSASFFLF